MLTEDQTRHLLAEAARTIIPGPEPDVEAPRRRWGAPVAAAAAVVLIVATISVVLGHHGGASTSAAPSPTPTTDTFAGDPTFHLGPDQIPAVAGYPDAVARHLIEERGWTVSEQPVPGCKVGTAMAAWPPTGTPTAAGSIVVLSVSARRLRTDRSCARVSGNSDPFLLWAEGLGPAPRFVSGVAYVDRTAGVHTFLQPTQAPDPANWPHLSDLVTAATALGVRRSATGLRIVAPAVTASSGCTALCANRTLTVRSGGRTVMTVDYHLTSDESIDAVTVHDRRVPAAQGGWPEVVGDSPGYATLRLRAWGYDVTPVYRADCAPTGVVSRLAIDGDNAIIGVTESTGSCDDSPLLPVALGPNGCCAITQPVTSPADDRIDHYRRTAAVAFIGFADGLDSSPAWADRVAYRVDGRRVATLTPARAQRPASWLICPRAPASRLACPLSALRAVRGLGDARLRIDLPPTHCPGTGTLPRPTSHTVTIMAQHACRSASYVTLTLDDNDRVSAVDLSMRAQ